MTRHMVIGALALVIGTTACAADPRMLKWESELERVERKAERGQHAEAVRGFTSLQRRALNPLDPQLLSLRKGWTYERAGKFANAMTLYKHVAQTGLRRMDRARGHYMMARLMEERGRLGPALKMYRRLVLTYPSLMPGLRGLAHAQRLLYSRGRVGVEEHLTWLRRHYPTMRHTQLGDNFVFAAAHEARKRYFATRGQSKARTEMGALAEELHSGRDVERCSSTLAQHALEIVSVLVAWLAESICVRRSRGMHRRSQQTFFCFAASDRRRWHLFFWRGACRSAFCDGVGAGGHGGLGYRPSR